MISDRLKEVILTVLELPDFNLEEDTTANMVPKWDSLSHLSIITAIEAEYAVKFRATEILKLKTIGDLQRLVDSKTGVRAT
jgi:acyl carrier protein